MNETVPITEFDKSSIDKNYHRRGWIALGVVVVGIVGVLWFHTSSCTGRASSSDTQTRTIVIEEGSGVKEIAETLKQNDIIQSVFGFQYCAWRKRGAGNLLASTYNFSPSQRVQDIIAILQGGEDNRPTTKVTVIEGWTIGDIAQEIEKKKLSTSERFITATQKASKYRQDFSSLDGIPDDATLEGYLFPDTYFFDAESVDDRTIIEKMLTNFESKVTPEMRDQIASQGRSLHDVMILASIVEREAKDPEDAPKIAGVFMNRLEKGMKLQSDATVNYVTGKQTPRASAEDIKSDSPYNTYVYEGLPVGPISNPGLIAIQAAITPSEHNYFYFVNEQQSGKAIFATTLEEHNANKKKYLE